PPPPESFAPRRDSYQTPAQAYPDASSPTTTSSPVPQICQLCRKAAPPGEMYCLECQAKAKVAEAERVIKDVKTRVQELPEAEEILRTAKYALSDGDYKEAIAKAEIALTSANTTQSRYIEVDRIINETQALIIEQDRKGLDITRARSSLYLASSFMKSGNFAKANEYAQIARERALTALPKGSSTVPVPAEPARPTSQIPASFPPPVAPLSAGTAASPQPSASPPLPTLPEIKEISPGHSYLFRNPLPDKCFSIFMQKVKGNPPMARLSITRTYPEHIKEKYKVENVKMMWLTQTEASSQEPEIGTIGVFSLGLSSSERESEDTISPTNIARLTSTIKGFIDSHERSIILLEGLEYLIIQNDFRTVLKLIQLINEYILLKNAILLVPVDPSTMDSKELKLLEKDMLIGQ
ncbi:MAG: DUF835 domain-containing protein, partial [Thermoplasmata archaeon]